MPHKKTSLIHRTVKLSRGLKVIRVHEFVGFCCLEISSLCNRLQIKFHSLLKIHKIWNLLQTRWDSTKNVLKIFRLLCKQISDKNEGRETTSSIAQMNIHVDFILTQKSSRSRNWNAQQLELFDSNDSQITIVQYFPALMILLWMRVGRR